MNILILHGSPRKKGNTSLIAASMLQGIKEVGASAELVRLPELDIHPCIGCGSCEKNGTCIFKDDMTDLYSAIETSDRIVIASPIYFYNVTAQTKLFIDRCQALWSRKYILGQKIGTNTNRRGYLVSTAATRGERIFEGTRLTARYVFDAMDCDYADDFLIRGLDKAGAVAERKDILQDAVRFGRDLCND
jgi:multimeric flavodoxin WrbA